MKELKELEHGNINKLMVKYCIPSLAGNLVTAVYNIVDQIFIGNSVGMLGNAATNVVFPIITLLTALSLMCGVGTSAAFNLALGEKDEERAGRSIGNGFFLIILCGAVTMAAMLIFTRPLLYVFGCTDEIYPYAAEYACIVSFGFIFSMIGAAGPFILRADGSPTYSLVCTCTGAVLNVGLDALFVFGFDMGIAGAAWATVISQAVSAFMVIVYLPRFRTLRLKARFFKPNGRLLGKLAFMGAGPATNFLTQALVQVFLNNALRTYGALSIYGSETTLAAAGVANKVNTIATAVVTGMTNGIQPLISYNYGRENYERVAKIAKKNIKIVLIIGTGIFACYMLIPKQITAFFGSGSDEYFEFAALYFRIFLMLITINGLQVSVNGIFSGEGRPALSVLTSITRQLILLPPLLVILPKFLGLAGVLASGPIADGLMAVLALTLLIRELSRLKRMGKEAGIPAA